MSGVENPAAFPQNEFNAYTADRSGMTLRDWFAGQALAGIASGLTGPGEPLFGFIATEAYRLADAMLAARTNGGAA